MQRIGKTRAAICLWVFLGIFLGTIWLGAVPARAQGQQAWFGIDTLEARAKWSRGFHEAYQNPDIPPLSLRLSEAEDPYTDITGDQVHGYLQDIMDITQQTRPEGERYWGRIAGSESERTIADYMATLFSRFGLEDVRTETVQGGKQWWPLDWQVTLIGDPAYGAGTEDVALTSAFPALQLSTGAISVVDLEAELVYVGLGHPVDLVGRDVTGKIAVIHGALETDPFFQTARGNVNNIIEAGAVGVLMALAVPGNYQYALEDMGPPDAPSFILGGDDGRFVKDAIAAAGASNPITARLNLQTEVRDGWQGKNVIGMIRGRIDEYIVLVAHLDGYFEAANDNGGGLASLLALAKHYSTSGATKPNRNMLFVGTSGHHEFSDGVAAFIKEHTDILAKTVFVFNIEHPSSIMSFYRGELKFHNRTNPGQLAINTAQGTRSLTVSNRNPSLISFYRDAIDRYGLVIGSMVGNRPTGDAFGFYEAGYPVAQILDANLWYHSTGDRIDTIHPNGLERATRLYADVLDKIDRASWAELRKSGAGPGRPGG